MSTPPTWTPQPPDDRRAASPEPSRDEIQPAVTAPAPAPVDPFRVTNHPTSPYDTDPYGAPALGSNPATTPYPYGYAYGPGNTYAAQRTSGLAIASLVTSLVGFLLPITAPVGLVLGIMALRAITRDGTQGRGLAIGGIAVGAVMTLAFVLGVIAFVGLIATFPGSGGFTT